MYSDCKSIDRFGIRKLRVWFSCYHHNYGSIVELYAQFALFVLHEKRHNQDWSRSKYILDIANVFDDRDTKQYKIMDNDLLRYVFWQY